MALLLTLNLGVNDQTSSGTKSNLATGQAYFLIWHDDLTLEFEL